MSIEVDGLCEKVAFDFDLFAALEIKMPGGVSIKPKLDFGELPDVTVVLGNLLRELNPALTPLVPVFRLIDLAMALVNFCKAVPDSLGPPPDPTKIASALEDVIKKAGFLAQLVPILSIPIMVKGILGVVIGMLSALKATLANLVTVSGGLSAAADLKTSLESMPGGAGVSASVALQASIDCAQANFDLQLQANAEAMAPLASLLSLLKLFADIAGLPVKFPSLTLDVSSSASLAASLPIIDDFINVLQTVRDAIPVP